MKLKLNKIWAVIFIMALCILPMINLVSAADQTQQFNKIFLSPFYTPSLNAGVNYTFNVTVSPPDGVSSVKSAIINLDAYINPTRTFLVWINGQVCNNPSYLVSTTYASAGKAQVYFDCSNRITNAGVYNVTVQVTGGAIGPTTGWLDLTYMNKPGKKLNIFGTEYTVGDNGKIFLQLLENQITPINNASCYLTIYYPNGVIWYDQTMMTHQIGSKGLYYFDFTAPSTLGVYMTDIYCEYTTTETQFAANGYSILNGWYVSGNGTSLEVIDTNYLIVVEKNFNTGAITNLTTLLMSHLDEYTGTSTLDSSSTPATGTHYLNPAIGIPGQAGSAGVRYGNAANDYTQFTAASKFNLANNEGYMVCFSFNESVSNANGNRLISAETGADVIRFSFDGGNQMRFTSDRSGSGAQTVQTAASFVDSLWHTVCGYSNFTTQQLYIDGVLSVTAANIQSGTLTAPSMSFGAKDGGTGNDATVSMDEVCYVKGTDAQFASPSPQTLATNYNTNKQCGVPVNSLDMNITVPGISPLAQAINFEVVTTYQWNEIGETVQLAIWNYTGSSWYTLPNSLSTATSDSTVGSTLTGLNISQFLSGGTMIIRMNDSLPTGPSIGTLRLNQVRVDQTAYVESPATAIRGGGEIHVSNIPEFVWEVPIRTLTSYPNITASIDTAAVAVAVWNATDRNLTYYQDVTNYTLVGESVWTSSLAIPSGLLTQIANAIWTSPTRNLTFYPTQVDLTNYTLIAETTWNYATRNLTFYENFGDQTNYTWLELYFNNVPSSVWNYSIRNLTFYENFGDQTDYDRIILGVWNATTRNLTYYPAQVDLTNYTLIIDETSKAVWNVTDRNLTFYPEQMDLTNYTQISEVVWTAANRNLTYYEDVTDYDKIFVGVWNYTTRNLTFYPAQVDLTNYTRIDETILAVNQTLFDKITTSTNSILSSITDINSSLTSEILLVPSLVWTFNNRNLTYYENFGDQTNYTEIANSVWNAAIRNLTFYPTQLDLTNYTLITEGVWNATDRNLTYYQNFGDQTNYTQIIVGVWNATDRNLTFYPAQVDLTNYTAITENVVGGVWNATDRNLTFYPEQIDLTNYTEVANSVWNAGSRNLTYTNDVTDYNRIIVGVWNATDRNLTFYPAQVDMTNYTLIGDLIVNSSINYTLVADNVWQWNGVIIQNVLDQIGSSTSDYVWNATDRNLTFYPAQVDLTNYTLIADTVWTNLNRTLTDFDFTVSVNETAIANAVWQSVDRTLTGFNFTVNATMDINETEISDAVWSAVNRTLTDYNQTAQLDLTDYEKIQTMVWNATSRNLTYYENFGDQTNYTLISDMIANNSINYTLIQEMVWDATNRTLTDFNFDVNVNTTAIAEAVWASVNRTLTDYNQSDLTDYEKIQTMVWNATTRTITEFNFTVNVNQTQLDNVVNYTLIQQMVWEATNRTLTEFNFSVTVNTTEIADAVWASSNRTLSYFPEWADTTNYTLIQEVVWTNAVRTLTDFNFTVETNNTNIAEAVWQYTNKTVQFANGSVETVGDIRDMGHTYVGGTEYVAGDDGKITIRLVRGTGALAEVEEGAQCSVNILYPNMTDFVVNGTMTEIGDGAYYYNLVIPTQVGIYTYFTNCNISDRFYFSLDDFHVYAPDYSSIPGQVWNNPSRNLTYTQPGLTANDVWTNPTRDLTYYPTANLTLSNESIQELGDAVWQYDGTISPNILTQFSNAVSCTIQKIQADLNLKPGVQLNTC